MIGLCGSHRSGKTSLAKAYAEGNNAVFLETSVSAIFADLGYDSSASFDFKTRLTIQEKVLQRLDSIYADVPCNQLTITDRTPIDLMGYTMADAVGNVVPAGLQKRFHAYVEDCFAVLNKRFSTVVLVQPGIPLVKAKGKGAMNGAYIEHLNSVMFGLMVDERTKCTRFHLRRQQTDFKERLSALENAVGKAERIAMDHVANFKLAGGYVH